MKSTNDSCHNPSDLCPTFTNLKHVMTDFDNKIAVERSAIVDLLNDLHRLRGSYLSLETLAFLDISTVDLVMSIIANNPSMFDKDLKELFEYYWLAYQVKIEKLISPRNLCTLSQCKEKYLSWTKFENLILSILSKDVMTIKTIQDDVLLTLKQEYDQDVLARFASCLKSVVNQQRSSSNEEEESEMTEIVEWLSWFCAQND